ncbi:hypothetical protein HJ183_23335 [Vibrio parahaemolyticus]|uniref:hypothetical protein n=1 Tax=Vibrio parahaemolyticus TaxID=670 RepID=UPI0004D34553|nr:hypothetical protein [Vibrio parahaemolyticus]EKB1992576.1 hypothetical protein [Vibrio parahaemolyticus]EME0136062.1 hypothetical protein [Vibrio parahaemolyticus]MBE3798443.1 hypothetical protein [Vibrio parahaemolyticus]MBE3849469.1 hypothetical protein [Vibrio parahaemolyticus]MBE3915065.1 hypothetical protein [Vibrio parahaemolyticus]
MRKKLVVEWAGLLSSKLNCSADEISESGLMCYDFSPDNVEVIFEDESYCKFNHAFALDNPDKGQVAIFTEHCGYHVFSNIGVTVIEYFGSTKTVIVESEW